MHVADRLASLLWQCSEPIWLALANYCLLCINSKGGFGNASCGPPFAGNKGDLAMLAPDWLLLALQQARMEMAAAAMPQTNKLISCFASR